jgi:hypothetical protein
MVQVVECLPASTRPSLQTPVTPKNKTKKTYRIIVERKDCIFPLARLDLLNPIVGRGQTQSLQDSYSKNPAGITPQRKSRHYSRKREGRAILFSIAGIPIHLATNRFHFFYILTSTYLLLETIPS